MQDVMNMSDKRQRVIEDILDAAKNVAELLTDDELDRIGTQVVEDYRLDKASMAEWLTCMEHALKLASQLIEVKNDPWPNASNVKHSLILEACIQFASRALPEFIRDGKITKIKIFGKDNQGMKRERAARVADYMNFDIMENMDDWEDDLDKLLTILSMMGTMFKKTYYCPIERKNKAVLCLPDKIIINQNVKKLSEARRISHEIELYASQIEERKRAKIFLDVELDADNNVELPDNDQEYFFIEQLRYLDLDHDGLPEVYIVTVHEESQKVVRITPCFGESDITWNDTHSEIVSIRRREYYADFHFIKSLDGTFYSYGFGYLLSHASHTINTLLNQLIDAGTLDNLQSGFIGKGARVKGGQTGFRPGEWKKADASGVDLKNSIVPLPTKGPSAVLMQLLEFLLNSYYRMISISDIMSGQISGSNTTAAEAIQALEQGIKVMSAIYKRVYRGLKKEFYQLYLLNRDYLTQDAYVLVLDDPTADKDADFESVAADIRPVADPTLSTQLEELTKLKMVMDTIPLIPEIKRVVVGRLLLRSMRFEDEYIDMMLPERDPDEPSPEQLDFAKQLEEREKELNFRDREVRVLESEVQLKAFKAQYEIMKLAAESEKLLMSAQKEGATIDIEKFLARVRGVEAEAKYIQAITPDSGASNGQRGIDRSS
jgi:chaperonin GroES